MSFEIYFKICIHQDFPDSPVVKTVELPMRGAQVWSLVRELRSHMLCGVAKKLKTKQNTHVHTQK